MKNIVALLLLVLVGLTGCAPTTPVQPIITYTPSNTTATAPVITPAANPIIIITPNVTAANITTASVNETAALPANTKIELPESKPVIFEQLQFLMRGQICKLYIYSDGTVFAIEEKGFRPAGLVPIRTWKKGQISQDELKQILAIFQSPQFASLNNSYRYPENPTPPFVMGDGTFTFTVDSGALQKTVYAGGYLTPDRDETYPMMPAPLNDIYVKLRAVEQSTAVVATENITQ